MKTVLLALALCALPRLSPAAAPLYSLESIVNAATGVPGDFAPNGMVSLYGSNLAYRTETAPGGSGALPTTLAGVSVNISGQRANLYYVSPGQINLLIPAILLPGPVTLSVAREGFGGPELKIVLKETAPGFFALDTSTVIATHANGDVITDDNPAVPEEVVVLYAAGLGRTNPDVDTGRPSTHALPILLLNRLAILLGNNRVASSNVQYAGIAPGFAGLYQINLKLPPDTSADPEIRVFIGEQGSPSYMKLPVRIQ